MRIISGKYGRRRFPVPTNITARPTTDFARENIFNVIRGIIDIGGIRALDLFAGTGAITFELLSRDAASVTAVEKAAVQARFIASVARTLGEENLRLVRGDAFRFLSNYSGEPFDLVFADPPYAHPDFDRVPSLVLSGHILRPGGYFILEHNAAHSYTDHPLFVQHRTYGSVNFSIFRTPEQSSQTI